MRNTKKDTVRRTAHFYLLVALTQYIFTSECACFSEPLWLLAIHIRLVLFCTYDTTRARR
jgi:hypothetical protein